jgi:hypothetical protein
MTVRYLAFGFPANRGLDSLRVELSASERADCWEHASSAWAISRSGYALGHGCANEF